MPNPYTYGNRSLYSNRNPYTYRNRSPYRNRNPYTYCNRSPYRYHNPYLFIYCLFIYVVIHLCYIYPGPNRSRVDRNRSRDRGERCLGEEGRCGGHCRRGSRYTRMSHGCHKDITRMFGFTYTTSRYLGWALQALRLTQTLNLTLTLTLTVTLNLTLT